MADEYSDDTENERFPPGYEPPVNVVNSTQLQDLQARLGDALLEQGLNITAVQAPPTTAAKRFDPHAGYF